jgi:hypothetical protein
MRGSEGGVFYAWRDDRLQEYEIPAYSTLFRTMTASRIRVQIFGQHIAVIY